MRRYNANNLLLIALNYMITFYLKKYTFSQYLNNTQTIHLNN